MKLVHSPLFEPVLWEGRGFKILDETLIPERIEYIRIDQVAPSHRCRQGDENAGLRPSTDFSLQRSDARPGISRR